MCSDSTDILPKIVVSHTNLFGPQPGESVTETNCWDFKTHQVTPKCLVHLENCCY